MHQSSIDKMQSFKDKYLQDKQSDKLIIFDLGSQNIGGSYRPIFESPNWKYFGVDVEAGENVDIVISNPYRWDEIQSGSVDVLISGQTLEHIEYFWITIMEIARVLKSDGICCLVAPSSGYEHRYPVDCWRFYPDGMRAIAEFAKLEVLETFTQWKDEDYADGSNVWHDSVLIARKPLDNKELMIESQHFNERYLEILTERGQTELYRFQLQRSQCDLANLQNKLHQTEYYAQQYQSELDHSKSQLERLQSQLQQTQQCVKAMESSKFWKMRNVWFKLKGLIIK
jgi:SAM-dependent methyltransferase